MTSTTTDISFLSRIKSSATYAASNSILKDKQKMPGTKRLRTGCLTCRKRRKKCDESYPICGDCLRLNLVCDHARPRAFSSERPVQHDEDMDINGSPDAQEECRETQPSGTSVMMTCGAICPPVMRRTHQRSQRYLLRYYAEALTKLCSTSSDGNTFLTVFMPMAMESSAVLYSVMAWAASHLHAFNKRFSSVAGKCTSAAFASLAGILQDESQYETNLAACLCLCAAASPSNQWFDHLKGAEAIIRSSATMRSGGRMVRGTECFMDSSDGQWLLRDFAYHDILGAVASGRQPLIKGVYWLSPGQRVLDACMGLGSELLGILSEICCLDSGILDTRPSGDDTDKAISGTRMANCVDCDSWRTFRDIESRLLNWPCPKLQREYLTELAECHRLATLICLYRKGREIFPQDLPSLNDKIAQNVGRLVRMLDNIPYQSMAEGGLIFPTFIAGGDAMNEAVRSKIRTRMQQLLEYRGFPHIALASEVLEESWRLKHRNVKGPHERDVDWRDVVDRRGIKLMLH